MSHLQLWRRFVPVLSRDVTDNLCRQGFSLHLMIQPRRHIGLQDQTPVLSSPTTPRLNTTRCKTISQCLNDVSASWAHYFGPTNPKAQLNNGLLLCAKNCYNSPLMKREVGQLNRAGRWAWNLNSCHCSLYLLPAVEWVNILTARFCCITSYLYGKAMNFAAFQFHQTPLHVLRL